MGETKIGRGRPSKLDDTLAVEIAARLLAGDTVTDVAQSLAVSPRSISRWRQRAWSRDERDAPAVLLEQMLSAGYAAAAERHAPTLQPLDALVADLGRPLDEFD